MGRLDNKIAVITGAGGGIGLVAAQMFADEGATVIILEVNEASAKAAEQSILEKGGVAKAFAVDISDEQAVNQVFAQIEEAFGGVDVLYNNASVFWGNRDTMMDATDMNVFDRIMKINLYGLVHCSKYAIPMMKKRGGGSIINTGSSAAVYGVEECTAYTATKGATVALTRSMAVEYGEFNIRTNCICPAAIESAMLVQSNTGDPNYDRQAFLDNATPLKRYGKPEEVAGIAVFLATDDAAYMNGAILVADGGITIMHKRSKKK